MSYGMDLQWERERESMSLVFCCNATTIRLHSTSIQGSVRKPFRDRCAGLLAGIAAERGANFGDKEGEDFTFLLLPPQEKR